MTQKCHDLLLNTYYSFLHKLINFRIVKTAVIYIYIYIHMYMYEYM